MPSSTCKQNRGLKRLEIQLHSKCEDSPCNHAGMMYINKISPGAFSVILLGFPIQGFLQKIRSQNTTGVIPAYWFQGRNQGLSDYNNLYKRWLRRHPIVTPTLQRNELVILSSFVTLLLISSGEDIASGSGWWAKNIITRMIRYSPSFCAFSKP